MSHELQIVRSFLKSTANLYSITFLAANWPARRSWRTPCNFSALGIPNTSPFPSQKAKATSSTMASWTKRRSLTRCIRYMSCSTMSRKTSPSCCAIPGMACTTSAPGSSVLPSAGTSIASSVCSLKISTNQSRTTKPRWSSRWIGTTHHSHLPQSKCPH